MTQTGMTYKNKIQTIFGILGTHFNMGPLGLVHFGIHFAINSVGLVNLWIHLDFILHDLVTFRTHYFSLEVMFMFLVSIETWFVEILDV